MTLTALETLWTVPYGRADGVPDLLDRPSGTLRSAMEAVVLQGLLRPPCVVSFSGGRDSSTVLALATHLARTHGLALPVPVTNRFPLVVDSDETAWQELVVRHLALPEWTRLEFTDELDVGGAMALEVLEALGVRAPFNLHFHEPAVRAARAGTVLTGVGGDELFLPVSRRAPYRLLSRRWSPHPGTVRSAAVALAPARLRAARAARRSPLTYPWIRPAALHRLRAEVAAHDAAEPLSWESSVRTWTWPGRRLQLHRDSLTRLGARHGVEVESPFCTADVLATVATAWGRPGPRGRAAELSANFDDLLPPELVARRDKSSFNGAFWAGPAREWAGGWTGAGVDDELVDAEVLAQEWAGTNPDPHSFSLLHQALLASRRELPDPPER